MTQYRVLLPWLIYLMLAAAYSPLVFAQDNEQLPGDIDGDGTITIEDINSYCASIARTRVEMDDVPDINGDGRVDFDDMAAVLEAIGSRQGDANLDGLVQFRDFVKLSANFGRGTGPPFDEGPVFWSDGDFNCDDEISFVDFLYMSNNYGEFQGSAVIKFEGVPEPSTNSLALVAGMLMLLALREKRWAHAST